mgnify:CR=1 FL=1
MENSKELIIKYFFNEHLKVKEIAEIIHTSSSYITKIIKLDKRYLEEKEYRNNKSKEKRKKDYVVLIPIINEGERIKKELQRAAKYKVSEYADIVICDGGSSDGIFVLPDQRGGHAHSIADWLYDQHRRRADSRHADLRPADFEYLRPLADHHFRPCDRRRGLHG